MEQRTVELIKRSQKGDREAEEILQKEWEPLIKKRAFRRTTKFHDEEDLIQAGRLGLHYAIHRFDPERGLKFMTYCFRCVDGFILRYLREDQGNGRMKQPVDRFQRRTKLFILSGIIARQGGEATRSELARALSVTEEEVDEILSDEYFSQLQTLYGSRWDHTTSDELWKEEIAVSPNEVGTDEDIQRMELDRVLDMLPEREGAVMKALREGMQQVDIARHLGVSRERVRQIVKSGIERSRKILCVEEAG